MIRTNGVFTRKEKPGTPTPKQRINPPPNGQQNVGTRRGEASLAQVHLQEGPSAWTYERRASVKLAKSQLRTVRASFENPSLEPKVCILC